MFMSEAIITVDNFIRAETHRMFNDLQAMGGAPGAFFHVRSPVSVEAQPVIRMNRDTLYSAAVLDLSQGATVTIPDAGARYLSVMVITRTTTSRRCCTSQGPITSSRRRWVTGSLR